MKTWVPWLKFKRLLEIIPYNKLTSINDKEPHECEIMYTNDVKMVIVNNKNYYGYDALSRWYIDNPCVIPGVQIMWENVSKLIQK